MALINRVTRLFRADMHAVLDKVEEPDVLLRQAIREMEEEFGRDEQRLKLLHHEQSQLSRRKTELMQSLKKIEEELDVCFTAGNEALAHELIRRRLVEKQTEKFLSTKLEKLDESETALSGRLRENSERLESMRQKAELLAREDEAGNTEPSWGAPEFTVTETDVEVAFLREKQKRSRS